MEVGGYMLFFLHPFLSFLFFLLHNHELDELIGTTLCVCVCLFLHAFRYPFHSNSSSLRTFVLV